MHPFGQRLACAAAGGDAERVEAGTDEEVLQFGCLAENEVAVGGEALGAIDKGAQAGVRQRRYTADGQFHRGREVVPVALE